MLLNGTIRSPANPFPGVRAFREHEAELFFGREREIARATQKLAEHRLITIVGRSGCGKSSFVRAGLLPTLHRTLFRDAKEEFSPIVLRPGSDPIKHLAQAITDARLGPGKYNSDVLNACEAQLRSSSTSLVDPMQSDLSTSNQPQVVIVDQFEELFRNAVEDESNARFVQLLLSATDQSTIPAAVVLILRSEFLGDADRFPRLSESVSETLLLLPRLTPRQISDAIMGPLQTVGATIEENLIGRVIEDMTGPADELALMQQAMRNCWRYASEEVSDGHVSITQMHYAKVGGVDSSLDYSAEAIFAELGRDQREMCERLFCALATRDSRGYALRRPLRLGNTASIAGASMQDTIAIASAFSREGILVPSVDTVLAEDTVLDISHEAVLRNWRRLIGWLDEEHRLAETYRTYVYLARQAQQGQADLLSGGLDIERARAFRENRLVSSEWARLYGSHADFEAVQGYLSASLTQVRTGGLRGGSTSVKSRLPNRRKIFICYRRDDSSHPSDRIFNGLTTKFAKNNIFYDIQSIPAGLDFSAFILERIRECAVLLAVIGNHWLDARFDDGPRKGEQRIDDPTDFVRVEIETAFREGVRVIPVLVGTRKMLAESELPSSLQALASLQAVELPSGIEFNDRLERLVVQLQEAIPPETLTEKLSSWFTSFVSSRRH